jgi:hypothetical protein
MVYGRFLHLINESNNDYYFSNDSLSKSGKERMIIVKEPSRYVPRRGSRINIWLIVVYVIA